MSYYPLIHDLFVRALIEAYNNKVALGYAVSADIQKSSIYFSFLCVLKSRKTASNIADRTGRNTANPSATQINTGLSSDPRGHKINIPKRNKPSFKALRQFELRYSNRGNPIRCPSSATSKPVHKPRTNSNHWIKVK